LEKVQRALITVITLCRRIELIRQEGGDDLNIDVESEANMARLMIRELMKRWPDQEHLQDSLLSKEFSRFAIMRALGLPSTLELEEMDATTFYGKLWNL
jgi:hypothetical protein